MANDYETEAMPEFERGEQREMAYGCLQCEKTNFYISMNRHQVQCVQCFTIFNLVRYSCNHCCPSGYMVCPVCREGTETDSGCAV